MKRPKLTPAVSPKYLSDETKIYIFINGIPRIVYRIFGGILYFPPLVDIYRHPFLSTYTQTKKTMNTENIPGMCVLANHMRDLVTAENEWLLSHGIELVLEFF